MADEVDQAAEHMEKEMQARLAARAPVAVPTVSYSHCGECGEEQEEGRKHYRTCILCQTEIERLQKRR